MSIKRVNLLYRLVRHLPRPSKFLVINLTYWVIYLLKLNLVSNLYEIKRYCSSSISYILHLFVEPELILVRLLDATGYPFVFISVWFKVSYRQFNWTLLKVIVLYSQLFSKKLEKLRQICSNLFTNIFFFFFHFRITNMIWLIFREQNFIVDSHLKRILKENIREVNFQVTVKTR